VGGRRRQDWLLAKIEKKQTVRAANIADIAPKPFGPERLAA
jgi:hypothetical protein